MAKRLRDGDEDRWNNVDNGRPDHILTKGFRSFLKDFRALYEEFRIEKGYTAHLVNMCCPVARFWSDKYSDGVNSCHGLGFPTHQKLNEHIMRQHSPDLANKGKRTAPLLDREKYDAWKKSTTRQGYKMNKDDIREKWWATVVKLGLATRPAQLPENAHMTSAANQIPLIDGFVAWGLRRDQHAGMVHASTQTDSPEPVLGRDPATTAQKLSEIPVAINVVYQELRPNHRFIDSGYGGSIGRQEHLDDEKTPHLDGEPQQPRTEHVEHKVDFFPGITQFSDTDYFDILTEGASFDAFQESEVDFDQLVEYGN